MNFKLNLSDNKVWCFLRAFIRMSCLRRIPYYVWVGFLSFFADSKICNLRSGSVFSSVRKLKKKNITTGKAKRKEKREPDTTLLRNVCCPLFLIDWHLPNQPTKITSVACFISMQIYHTRDKSRLADLKIAFIFFCLFFATNNKTVIQSQLTSCEIKGDPEGYFCCHRR